MTETDTDQPAEIQEDLETTPLAALHESLGGRMVPFAGYRMPVQFPAGILAEHEQVRTAAGLFDVSHMVQLSLRGPSADATTAAVEAITPAEVAGLKPGRMRYTVFLNDEGGIVDDLIVTRPAQDEAETDRLGLVVNAARRDADLAYLGERLDPSITIELHDDRALLALQGPEAAAVLADHCDGVGDMLFMSAATTTFNGIPCGVSRSGYTGEDGFELSVADSDATAVAGTLLADGRVEPIGLGARDSLRLEAGLCLYGHDLDETTSPVEAGLAFTIGKRRRETGGFPGATRILGELADGARRRRVGIVFDGRAPAREGAALIADGATIGHVTSGGFSPTLQRPIAMGYVASAHAADGTAVAARVRTRELAGRVAPMPFVPTRYYRRPA